MNRALLATALFLFPLALAPASGASPQGVTQGGSTAGLDLFDFNSVPNPTSPWTPYSIIQGPGLTIGERMIGQTTTPMGNLEAVSGTPTLPLQIDQSVPAGMGVSVVVGSGPGDNDMAPEGPVGWPNPSSLGEGAFTIVFAEDQPVIGLSIGYATVDNSAEMLFYGRNGVLLASFFVSFTATLDPAPMVFSATTSTLIAAITVNNTDPGGLGYDDIFYDSGIIGTSYCSPAVPNSTGSPGRILAIGSVLVSDNEVTLLAEQLPAGQFGYFLVSRTQGMFTPPGSSGFICLSGNIGRYNAMLQIFQGPSGSLALDLGAIPVNPPIGVVPGDNWNFQAWYRDLNPGVTSNFTDAVTIVFQ